jgi:hypothetical protein
MNKTMIFGLLFLLLFVLFLILKLCGTINWSWWLVVSPLLGLFASIIVFFLGLYCLNWMFTRK